MKLCELRTSRVRGMSSSSGEGDPIVVVSLSPLSVDNVNENRRVYCDYQGTIRPHRGTNPGVIDKHDFQTSVRDRHVIRHLEKKKKKEKHKKPDREHK